MIAPHKSAYMPLDQQKIGRNILVVNCGSSSIKVSLFDHDKATCSRLLDLHLKGIHSEKLELEISSSLGDETIIFTKIVGISEGLILMLDFMMQRFHVDFSSLLGIGHRFVHGGNRYETSTQITPKVIAELQKLSDLAPLHNEASLIGIKTCLERLKQIPQVAVFDTTFHHAMPAVAANYALERKVAEKYEIKRYGFHGISHAFLWDSYKKHTHKNNAKIITMHLGNGCSITAIQEGRSLDTSMGFTPAEGLIMGTRAGDIDAAVVEFLCLHEKKTPGEVIELLNTQSGLLGVSGISSDMETLLASSEENKHARLAVEMFCYRVVKYLGAYIAILGGVDAIIFSGGIGENAPLIREQIMQKMEWFGLKLDKPTNKQAVGLPPGALQEISAPGSTVAAYVIATDENLFIAEEAQRILG